MKYAIVNGIKKEATKGLKGICPICGKELIAKCGNFKVNHWAHKVKDACDNWWENETLWHRKWKNYFPIEMQEKVMFDETKKEKHIADICTNHNLIIEFQHSSIKYEEKISRELFYKNLIWVVDGTRLKSDYQRFVSGKYNLLCNNNDFAILSCNSSVLPCSWEKNNVPVCFDFSGCDDPRYYIYCFLPYKFDDNIILVRMTKQTFINYVLNNQIVSLLRTLIIEINKNEQNRINLMAKHNQRIIFPVRRYYPYRRKFRF